MFAREAEPATGPHHYMQARRSCSGAIGQPPTPPGTALGSMSQSHPSTATQRDTTRTHINTARPLPRQIDTAARPRVISISRPCPEGHTTTHPHPQTIPRNDFIPQLSFSHTPSPTSSSHPSVNPFIVSSIFTTTTSSSSSSSSSSTSPWRPR
ncbi:hypothetical protein E2C01_042764 [Portunus trituberculatus]|uniref:Uncharacterized protein n=1 Tax=Portunus trituberculatus TaxID=210409 RepID=A0A5B7FUA1_PORTR|nr:hypothetical protein [Portunus trituberculatus]